MPKALTPRPRGYKRGPTGPRSDLPREVVDEVQRATKPTQVRDALSRLSRAAELLQRGDAGAAAAEAAKAKALSPRSASVREVLEEAIASGGSTLRDYVDAGGNAGGFQLIHRVYGRAGAPCLVCGRGIRVSRLGQRASFHCPGCQRR